MKNKFIMRRKENNLFFVKRRPNTGLGDLMTADPNEAAIYNHDCPFGFNHERDHWEAVPVKVKVEVLAP